jgi:CDP-diacylglycerol--glycerol-3-phosphate 3-phosphatidyltransferase
MRVTANQVTVARLLGLPFVGYTIYGDVHLRIWGVVVGTLIGLTDSLDGYLARKQGATVLGSLLDPVADKVFVVVCYACYADRGGIGWWVAAAILSRELLVTVLRSTLEGRGRRLPSTALAKAKTWIQMLGFGFIVLVPIVGMPPRAQTLALALVLGITWLSALDYLAVGIRALLRPDPDRWLHWLRFGAGALLPVVALRAVASPSLAAVPIIILVCCEMGRGALDNFAAHDAAKREVTIDLSWTASLWAEVLLLGGALLLSSTVAGAPLTALASAIALGETGRAVAKFARGPLSVPAALSGLTTAVAAAPSLPAPHPAPASRPPLGGRGTR